MRFLSCACRRHRALLSAGAAGFVLLAAPVFAQSTAPSSIVPQTLRPAPDPDRVPDAIPNANPLAPPTGAEGLSARIGSIEVDGGFPAMQAETSTLVAPHENRTVTLAEIYALAGAIEAAYVRKGYLLARVVVPPQRLGDGSSVRLQVVDGYIEQVDAGALPSRVRRSVERRVAGLENRRQLTLDEVEMPLVLAGAVPGLQLKSTLTRGDAPGATRLVLTGNQALVTGSLTVDNGYAASLGRYGVTAQLALNSVLGLGEQIYGTMISGYDLSRIFAGDGPLRVLGGGALLPIGAGRLSINPEVTFARTQPEAQVGVPRGRGSLRRYSVRGNFTLLRTRTRSLSFGVAVEEIHEANDALDFGVRLSDDHFRVARLEASYNKVLVGGGRFGASAQISHGLGHIGASADGALPSRQGADASFTKGTLSTWASAPLGGGLTVTLITKGQYSFGEPMFRSEQATLEGGDALSAYSGGETAVDSDITARAELSRSFAPRARLRLAPYVFAAAGNGWIEQPTSLEPSTLALGNLGAGARGALLGPHLDWSLEYGHGFGRSTRFRNVNRLNASFSLRF